MEQTADHKISVENFYGPLDLLLHLVKENEVDITRVSLTQVAQQYINFIQAMQKLDINVAGEFLVVASQLMLLKSRTLLPVEESEEAEEEEDASLDLIRKLLEYRKYKSLASRLGRMAESRALRFGCSTAVTEAAPPEAPEEQLRDMELWDLVLAFSRISKQTLLDVPIAILYQDVPIETFIQGILKALAEKKAVRFSELVGDRNDRGKVIGTFLAILELVKEQRVTTHQPDRYSDITVQLIENTPEAPL